MAPGWAMASVWGHTCAVATSGTLWCWGGNFHGQLGNGTKKSQGYPTQVGSLSSWRSVAAGYTHSCATRTDGSLWCWGDNLHGVLGSKPTPSIQYDPVQVGPLDTWASIASGGQHMCALRQDKTLWCWGRNDESQLGDGTDKPPTDPLVQVSPLSSWASFALGDSHSCATRQDKTLWCWGSNLLGQFGGQKVALNSPTKIGSSDTWMEVSAGRFHTCATRTDGSLWCWGTNHQGNIGNGAESDEPVPVPLGGAWKNVSANGGHTCAVRQEGTLWCWGENYSGQLGDGTKESRSKPTQVGALSSWRSVATGALHTCAVRQDDTLWCWGKDAVGLPSGGTEWLEPTQISPPPW